jgi:hypothetical protein
LLLLLFPDLLGVFEAGGVPALFVQEAERVAFDHGGSAGGTGIAVFAVTPGQTITITVGAGATGANVDYTKGSNFGSYAGNGGSGFVSITPLSANVAVYNSAGSYTYAVPAGVNSLNVAVTGGGGGGAAGNDGGYIHFGWSGGGGGSGANGSNAASSSGGNGGIGLTSSVTNNATYYGTLFF